MVYVFKVLISFNQQWFKIQIMKKSWFNFFNLFFSEDLILYKRECVVKVVLRAKEGSNSVEI